MDKNQLLSLISKTKKLLTNYEEAINNSHIPLWWFESDIQHYINIKNISNENF